MRSKPRKVYEVAYFVSQATSVRSLVARETWPKVAGLKCYGPAATLQNETLVAETEAATATSLDDFKTSEMRLEVDAIATELATAIS